MANSCSSKLASRVHETYVQRSIFNARPSRQLGTKLNCTRAPEKQAYADTLCASTGQLVVTRRAGEGIVSLSYSASLQTLMGEVFGRWTRPRTRGAAPSI